MSLESSSVCGVEAAGNIVREGKVASEPETLIAWFRALGFDVTRTGLEAGPLSQWLFGGCSKAALRSSCWRRGMYSMRWRRRPVKTDRKDARGIAQLMRMGWFKPVHCKSIEAQDMCALLSARETVAV